MLKRALISLFVFPISAGFCASQTKSRDAEGHEWWQQAVFHEIYPRSYGVSDYESIDPMYGKLSDFDRVVKEGRKNGIHIILDFVLDHTSDQHAWFKVK